MDESVIGAWKRRWTSAKQNQETKKRNDSSIIQMLLNKYDNLILSRANATCSVYEEKNELELQKTLINEVKKAHDNKDLIVETSNFEVKKCYDTLTAIGAFEFIEESKAIKTPNGYTPPSFKYKCNVSISEIEQTMEERKKELNNTVLDLISKREELTHIIEAYNKLKANSKLITAIKNADDIIAAAGVFEIELLATPYEENYPPRYTYHKEPYMEGTATACLFGKYRPKFISNGDIIATLQIPMPDEYQRLTKYICCTFSKIPSTYTYRQLEITEIWGSILSDNPVNSGKYYNTEAFVKYYNKIIYLFDSLREYGLIERNDKTTLYAFLLLIYNAWYESMKNDNIVHHLVCSPLKDEEECFRYLYANGIPFDSAAYYMARRAYVLEYNVNIVFLDNYYKEKFQHIYEEEQNKEEKKSYIDSLIEGNKTPGASFLTIEDTFLMEGYQFEEVIAELFKKMGYDAFTTKKSGDQGVDVIAKKGMITIAIQTKCYPNSVVGNAAVQEVVAGMSLYNAEKAMVITNSTYTASAFELANSNNVELWDKNDLEKALNKYRIYNI